MKDFDYNSHLRRYRELFGIADNSSRENVVAAETNAQHDHALAVFNPLRDSYTAAVQLAGVLKNQQARFYMLYGAGRRLGMMFHAYRRIIFKADPKRSDPLAYEEQQELSLDINVLYLHAMGVLDNYAWCFLFERHSEREGQLSRTNVGLFSEKFRAVCSDFEGIRQDIDAHSGWFREMKAKRDPIAHRIPLYIPNAAIRKEDAEIYDRLYESFRENTVQNKFVEADEAFDRLNKIGQFVPGFVHHPDDGVIPLYPTVPADMGHIVQIGVIVRRVLGR